MSMVEQKSGLLFLIMSGLNDCCYGHCLLTVVSELGCPMIFVGMDGRSSFLLFSFYLFPDCLGTASFCVSVSSTFMISVFGPKRATHV